MEHRLNTRNYGLLPTLTGPARDLSPPERPRPLVDFTQTKSDRKKTHTPALELIFQYVCPIPRLCHVSTGTRPAELRSATVEATGRPPEGSGHLRSTDSERPGDHVPRDAWRLPSFPAAVLSAIPAGFNLGFPGQTLPPCAVPAAPAGRKALPAAGQNPWAPPSIRKTPRTRGSHGRAAPRTPPPPRPRHAAHPPRAEDLPGAPRPQDLASEDPGILPHNSLYRWETEAKATRWFPSPAFSG
ncbi:translation initiation factor IF-2-like isoform X2 [Leopardus geoffroyi]|uniref:translation initiation factor IF-2-like isoform X2 n=1 Tax=Leopardus geoffroyi TaxID=46844 RepID=UPI001E262492|nr:translation initiation factor IF-2-like isoform X2 [Leopardus geoffroyi]